MGSVQQSVFGAPATTPFGFLKAQPFSVPSSQPVFGQQTTQIDQNQQYVQFLEQQFSTLTTQVNAVRQIFSSIFNRNISGSTIFSLQLAQDQLEVIAAEFRANVKKASRHEPLAKAAAAAAVGYRAQINPLYEQVAQATLQVIQHIDSVEKGLISSQKDALQPGVHAEATRYIWDGKEAGKVGMELSRRLHNLRMQDL